MPKRGLFLALRVVALGEQVNLTYVSVHCALLDISAHMETL